jgi:hypothetical protein|tara:strand:+ start:364 stop:582 length:219 start_codon:yes stop_codon:yes gene_type:complete
MKLKDLINEIEPKLVGIHSDSPATKIKMGSFLWVVNKDGATLFKGNSAIMGMPASMPEVKKLFSAIKKYKVA